MGEKLKTVSREELAEFFNTPLHKEEKKAASSFKYKDKTHAAKKYNTDSRQYNSHKGGNSNNKFNGRSGFSAVPSAPYNFVPLNNAVIKPALADFIKDFSDERDIKNGYREFIKSGRKYSGCFDVRIENLTPLYIAGENGFFSDGGNICIPGSSLRGCIKNIFKIVTNSGLNTKDDPDITDKHLYYRSMASGCRSFRDAYNDRMVDQVKKDDGSLSGKSKAQAGFLVKKNKEYYVCPGEFNPERDKGDRKAAVKTANPEKPYIKWENKNEAYVFTGQMKSFQWKDESKLPKNFSEERKLGERVDTRTGKVQIKIDVSKVHYYKISNPRWDVLLPIPQEVVRDYIDDKNRRGFNLLDEETNIKKGYAERGRFDYIIPCFYTASGGTVDHFGAGPFYRIPYKKSIGEHIPAGIKNTNLDFTSAVFGNKEYWAGRVFFEDSFLEVGQKADFYDKDYVKVLMGPNPTSFQFYLDSGKDKNALHWDEKTNIRGYKFYWHRKIDWREADSKMRKDTINKQIKPLKENHSFSGRIRFKNLDAAELGALSYVLGMCRNKDICFKLGMGKPVGMGTVKITAKLNIQPEDYYKRLFEQNSFAAAKPADMRPFVKEFTDYVGRSLAKNGQAKTNYDRRIKSLLLMLNAGCMDNDKWNREITRYMSINNKNDKNDKKTLNSRAPLPSIEEVVKQIE